jgi:hypothetical protein
LELSSTALPDGANIGLGSGFFGLMQTFVISLHISAADLLSFLTLYSTWACVNFAFFRSATIVVSKGTRTKQSYIGALNPLIGKTCGTGLMNGTARASITCSIREKNESKTGGS